MLFDLVVQNLSGDREINKGSFLVAKLGNNRADIVDLSQRLQERDHLKKTAIVRVVIPGQNWHGVLRVEIVRVRRVVQDDSVRQVAAQKRHIFDVAALIRKAVVTEQPERDQPVRIDRIHQRVGVNAHTRRVNDEFVYLSEALQEKLNARSDQNENLDGPALNNNSHLEISLTASTGSLHLSK